VTVESSAAVLRQVEILFGVGSMTGLPDGSVLDRFRSGSVEVAEVAFGILVERHGPMVLRVCRQILGDVHDAEDAAQATFLVLARQAGSIRRTDSLASWLYGVAARLAARARVDAARRRRRERRVAERVMARHRDDSRDAAETWPELYEELGRLPDRFRLPVLLCHLEGLSYEQAARQLGCPVRTVQSRLARARARLKVRLARRGLGPATAMLAAALAPDATAAAVSESWKQATVQAAVRYAAGGASAAMVPTTVAALAQGASRAMFCHRLMKWAAALVLVGLAASGAGMAMRERPASPETPRRTATVADDNRYRVAFPNGATVEVVGVSTVPTGPQTWWQPDGSPLAEAPVETIEPKTRAREGEVARVILVRTSGVRRDDMFRWLPTPIVSYWGGRPSKNGRNVPELDYYEATFRPDRADCAVRARFAGGPWTTEVSNDGRGGVGQFVNGHKFSFGKARPYSAHGRSMTVFAVAHNFFGQDRRLVAIDREGRIHPGAPSSGSDGDPKWVVDLIDAEFPVPPDSIQEYQVQFRPIELAEIQGIALNPRPAGK
jgi:RNA polymerase sigma factor (sigma-70 family)